MGELANQIQARRERLQRFAEAATRYQDGDRAVQIAILENVSKAQPKEQPERRRYETKNDPTAYVPVARRILYAVANEFDMPIAEIVSHHRDKKYTLPRFVAIGLFIELTRLSLPAIGRWLGNRDHTTIINGRRRIEALLESEAFRNRFDQIKAEVVG
jgi:chromosomal replication initiation ATPase DnaA